MGILRYFLAIVVVISHSPFIAEIPKPLYGNGGLAVCGFFVISGFYMSLIFDKYNLRGLQFAQLKNFYLSRMARIYPVYYVCLFITLMLYFLNVTTLVHPPFDTLQLFKPLQDKALYALSNLLILGQSFIRFFIYDPHSSTFVFHPTNNLNIAPSEQGSSFNFLGQSWSLSLELTFYFLVPFLLAKSKKFLFSLCFLSFLLRVILMKIDSKSLFASDIFFPLTLGVFLLGSLSHQCIYKHIQKKAASRWIKLTAGVLIIGTFLYSMYANLYHNSDHYTALFYFSWWSFVLLVALTIPYLFLYSKNSKWDQFIGELSYPVYMTHWFCIQIISQYTTSIYVAYYAIALATATSIILVFFVVKPIDKYRHKYFVKKKMMEENSNLPSLEIDPTPLKTLI